ncbi:ArsR/SmtB family transcription factor [Streptomyces sp. NEAU-Y11]|uniref:ArsR/SmtB family transcription factor n=1 Tax=Streptomyces cucumeris TaxID=2962890 RepID=UPI0020C88A9C|nr:ArsR family transcriptional regulator [Streptomyces sp. NEAU-Y11]MCP9211484.1 winged helix-turn-helix domain-containing protein [Streptomyces sp. NEAU-Y11]
MIEIELGVDDLARVRFAISPLQETCHSLWALRDPGDFPLHMRWMRLVRNRLPALDGELLLALVSERRWLPDFITPRPQSRVPEMAEELAVVRSTDPAVVCRDIETAYLNQCKPSVLCGDPASLRDRIAHALEAYWHVALEPHWRRMRAVLEADILYRAQLLADGGAAALFANLHPNVQWNSGVLRLHPMGTHSRVPAGGGLTLCPTLFGRKATAPIGEVPRVDYPARGVATLWESVAAPPADSLATLIGRPKATLLAALDTPDTTASLARALGVTPSAVSQHLSVLAACGLVARARAGRTVLYARSELGERLTARQGSPVAQR